MSQHVDLAFAFTALEVVLMGRAPHVPIETEACRTLALRGLRELGIEGLASRPYPTLSGGEQQRVQLARVLTQIGFGESGRYLLLDEPVSSLDPAQQHAALGCVRRIAQGGVGVLVVLHDLNLLAQYTDRLALLSGGRVRRVGAPRDVLEPALLGEVFDVEAHVSKLPWNEEAPWIVLRGR
jgi:iron complex transport system ATP-binding protein